LSESAVFIEMWTFPCFGQFFAAGVQMEAVMTNFMVEKCPHVNPDLLNTGVAELLNTATFYADEVVVLLETIGTFELCHIFAKLMFGHQIAGLKQVEGVINRGTTHPVIPVFHLDVEGFYIKVVGATVNFFEYGKSFRRFAVAVFFEIGREDFFYFFSYTYAIGHAQLIGV